MKDAFKYVISNGGVDTSTGYPAYMAKVGLLTAINNTVTQRYTVHKYILQAGP